MTSLFKKPVFQLEIKNNKVVCCDQNTCTSSCKKSSRFPPFCCCLPTIEEEEEEEEEGSNISTKMPPSTIDLEKFLAQHKFDGTICHPFTMSISGPSGSGKSTFVKDLLLNRQELISAPFDYVLFLIGTSAAQNPILFDTAQILKKQGMSQVEIWAVNQMYPDPKIQKKQFPPHLEQFVENKHQQGLAGCIVIDDLMQEVADMNILTPLFTRMSSHLNLSVIYITQNLFFQGKNAGSSMTLYRNTKYLVMFYSRVDKSTIRFLVQRMGPGINSNLLRTMLDQLLRKYRYTMINFDINRDSSVQFATRLFEKSPLFKPVLDMDIPHQTIITPNFVH
jgi:hypothetical protein